ncbi:neurogenic locus notch homolog protein 1-like [Neocloeon triangulifer]|uniref:neurogenic locus notch homolog protein 1-like n=1 Tax=Neocloeon triangulifer TaxID=2078957 RepID=UPI00286F7996|nr:neurogenic locus notch homolog protein 1-like [Neocloeon triangulifer]
MIRLIAVSLLVGLALGKPQTDPCHPSPCGPFTTCSVGGNGAAVCRCLSGYFPQPNTIVGCGAQCVNAQDCAHDQQCKQGKCVNSCADSPCGHGAECRAQSHRAVCSCPHNFVGDPLVSCRAKPEERIVVQRIEVDPCLQRSACGANAECRNVGGRPVCSCLPGHAGDPYSQCRRGECASDDECPSNRACRNYRCVSPCEGSCGTNADCEVRARVAVCRCLSGYVGDPFTSCRRYNPNELCEPSPCGHNTDCRVQNERPVCTCKPTFQGNPLSGCRHECESDYECAASQSCRDFRCQSACAAGACGEGAICEAVNHRASCKCPQHYLGNPSTRCYPECTQQSECPNHQACVNLRCVDPCAGACGIGADCRATNHKAVCSCPKTMTGDPFVRCRPFEKVDLCQPNPCGTDARCVPGHDNSGRERPVCTCPTGYIGDPLHHCRRGECITSEECASNRACFDNTCQNPCTRLSCGSNANCEVRNRVAVCSCPAGYSGDPLHNCYANPQRATSARYVYTK